MREQLTSRAPALTRKLKLSGGLAAGTLASLQVPVRRIQPFTKKLCTGEHRWRFGMFNKQCTRCGLEETR